MSALVIGSWRIVRDRRGRYFAEKCDVCLGLMMPVWGAKRKRYRTAQEAEAHIERQLRKDAPDEVIASYEPIWLQRRRAAEMDNPIEGSNGIEPLNADGAS